MLKRFLIAAALILGCGCFSYGQGVRIGDNYPITSSLTTPGFVSTVSNALINICTFPANAVPCTNKATTYSSVTLGTPCSTSTQVVLFGTNSCVSTTDGRGNWGAWVAAGNYDFTVTVSTGQSFGPFTLTAGIPSGTNLSLGALTVTGALNANGQNNINSSGNGKFTVGNNQYTSIAAAFAACPTAPAPCYIQDTGSQTITVGSVFAGVGQPVTIDCLGADQNGGGNILTFNPASAPATMFYAQPASGEAHVIIKGCNLQQQTNFLTQIVVSGGTATATCTTTNCPGLVTGNNVVVLGGNANGANQPPIGLAQNITVSASTFTYSTSAVNGTYTGNGLAASLAGPSCTLTQIAGSGTVGTATCNATHSFTIGMTLIIFGNQSASCTAVSCTSFNGAVKVTGTTATTFTFASEVSTTITGGIAYAGVNALLSEGSQGLRLENSTISYFSGIGQGIASTAAPVGGNYDSCIDSWSWFSGVGQAFYPLVSTGVINANKSWGCVLSNNSIAALLVRGRASENHWLNNEFSGPSSPVVQLGDGGSVQRDLTILVTTIEVPAGGAPSSQIGIQNFGNNTTVDATEGALSGAGSPVLVNDVGGGSHHGCIGASTAPASGGLFGTGIGCEYNMPNFGLDRSGNVRFGNATFAGISGAQPSYILGGTTPSVCVGNANTCRFSLSSSGLLGAGTNSHIGTTGAPVTDVNISSNFGFANTLTSTPTAARITTFPDNTGTVAETNLAQSFTAAQTLGAGGSLNATSLLISPTAPTIAGAGCGGTVAAIQNANGTASFEIFTGTAPTSAGCTVTFPAAAHHWICPTITHTSAVSTTNFIILQTGALSSTSVTFQLFSDVAAATAPTASDTWAVSGCHAN